MRCFSSASKISNIRAFGTNQPSISGVNGWPWIIGKTVLSAGITTVRVTHPVKITVKPSINSSDIAARDFLADV